MLAASTPASGRNRSPVDASCFSGAHHLDARRAGCSTASRAVRAPLAQCVETRAGGAKRLHRAWANALVDDIPHRERRFRLPALGVVRFRALAVSGGV